MKKLVILFIVLIILIVSIILGINLYNDYKVKNATIIIEYVDNLEVEFLSDVKVSDFIDSINGSIVDDYTIDTTEVGTKDVEYQYINDDGIKLTQEFSIEVIDTTAPVVWLTGSYSVAVGSSIDLTEKILCGDNYDANPICEVLGEYDMSTVGVYPLIFKATDSSGNITEVVFNLNVYKPSTSSSSSSSSSTTSFDYIIENYKENNTEIGIDVSKWQGDIDFDKLKSAGVEFIIIRIGTYSNGERVLDSKALQNIEGANEVGIPVGLYFYSYASSTTEAKEDALWIIEQIKDYEISLPIAFDWENFSTFNSYNLSFFGLTSMAETFVDTLEEYGYEGMVYGSKTYLEKIWLPMDKTIWLAHYTSKTSYTGEYSYWQICNNGRVSGIYGDVDIDIRYKD